MMPLTHKERMRRAIRREPVDRLPTQVNYTRVMGEKLAVHLGISLTDLPARLDNHLVRVDLAYPRRISKKGQIAYDWWGVGWSTETEGYWLADSPLAETESLEDFPWPDPHDPHLMDEAKETITFGERLAFYGGVSTQSVLPHGTPAEVGLAVNSCAQTLAAGGTGLVIAPSHRMTAEIPMENIDALLAAFSALTERGS